MSSIDVFHLFPHLPSGLQRMIWRYAADYIKNRTILTSSRSTLSTSRGPQTSRASPGHLWLHCLLDTHNRLRAVRRPFWADERFLAVSPGCPRGRHSGSQAADLYRAVANDEDSQKITPTKYHMPFDLENGVLGIDMVSLIHTMEAARVLCKTKRMAYPGVASGGLMPGLECAAETIKNLALVYLVLFDRFYGNATFFLELFDLFKSVTALVWITDDDLGRLKARLRAQRPCPLQHGRLGR